MFTSFFFFFVIKELSTPVTLSILFFSFQFQALCIYDFEIIRQVPEFASLIFTSIPDDIVTLLLRNLSNENTGGHQKRCQVYFSNKDYEARKTRIWGLSKKKRSQQDDTELKTSKELYLAFGKAFLVSKRTSAGSLELFSKEFLEEIGVLFPDIKSQ